jgi:hypothetical protein
VDIKASKQADNLCLLDSSLREREQLSVLFLVRKISKEISGGFREGALGAIAPSPKKHFRFLPAERLKNKLILRFIIMIAPSPLQ